MDSATIAGAVTLPSDAGPITVEIPQVQGADGTRASVSKRDGYRLREGVKNFGSFAFLLLINKVAVSYELDE